MGAIFIAKISDLSRFDSPDKLLAYAGLSPSAYQSGQLDSAYLHMKKRVSKYLRYAFIQYNQICCQWAIMSLYHMLSRNQLESYNNSRGPGNDIKVSLIIYNHIFSLSSDIDALFVMQFSRSCLQQNQLTLIKKLLLLLLLLDIFHS